MTQTFCFISSGIPVALSSFSPLFRQFIITDQHLSPRSDVFVTRQRHASLNPFDVKFLKQVNDEFVVVAGEQKFPLR